MKQIYVTDEYGVPTIVDPPIGSPGSSLQPLRYTGEHFDAETGFVYLRSRHYDPGLGRFISRDPYQGDTTAPHTLNRYVYVGNNPTNLTDPSGQQCGPACLALQQLAQVAQRVGPPLLTRVAGAMAVLRTQGTAVVQGATALSNRVVAALRSGHYKYAQGLTAQAERAAAYAESGALVAVEETLPGNAGRIDLVVRIGQQLTNVEVKHWSQSHLQRNFRPLADQARTYLRASPRPLQLEFVFTKGEPLTLTADEILSELASLAVDVSRVTVVLIDP